MSRPIAAVGTAALAATVASAAPAVTASARLRRLAFPRLSGIGDPRRVALTFDDGPNPASTPRVAEVLARYGVHATFFLLGCMVARSPALTRALADAGHEVAVHGWTHRGLLLRGPRATYADLLRAREVIREASGQVPAFFRPAYGVLTTPALLAARRLGLRPVLWSCWGKDWYPASTPDSVLRTVRGGLAGGATVLLHDSDPVRTPDAWTATVAALPRLLDQCAERGWDVGPLRDHFDPVPS